MNEIEVKETTRKLESITTQTVRTSLIENLFNLYSRIVKRLEVSLWPTFVNSEYFSTCLDSVRYEVNLTSHRVRQKVMSEIMRLFSSTSQNFLAEEPQNARDLLKHKIILYVRATSMEISTDLDPFLPETVSFTKSSTNYKIHMSLKSKKLRLIRRLII